MGCMKILARLRWVMAAVTFSVALSATLLPAQSKPEDYDGTYALKLGPRTLTVLHLKTENGKIAGTFERPKSFSGNIQFAVSNPEVVTFQITKAEVRDGVLHFTVQDPASKDNTDDFTLTLEENARAEMGFDLAGYAAEPMLMQRVSEAKVSTDWVPGRRYGVNDSDTDSGEMKRIYNADQQARQSLGLTQEDWKQINQEDAARRVRVKAMLDDGLLHTGADYKRAAFIFQHGDTPNDYLLAHTLAIVAVSKGDSEAIWIASATLDRYLNSINKPQIYGTQYNNKKNVWTQEPYDHTLVSDMLRRALDVPSQKTQERQLLEYRKANQK